MHWHLRLEAANQGEAGLGVGEIRDPGLELEEAIDVGVDVARLPREARKWYASLPSVYRRRLHIPFSRTRGTSAP